MAESVLVVAAHPDDEVLGCGGTLAGLVAQGAEVHVSFIADGVTSRGERSDVQLAQVNARQAAAMKAADILGVKSVTFGDFPDNRLDTVALLDVTQKIESLIAEYRPDIVFTHHGGDLNIDHQRVHEAVVTACRPQLGHPVETLLFFEVPSSTEWQVPGSAAVFAPNWFVDISAGLERKLAALDAYAAELRESPHPRSRDAVEQLARWRGATVGASAAEAFVLGRKLV